MRPKNSFGAYDIARRDDDSITSRPFNIHFFCTIPEDDGMGVEGQSHGFGILVLVASATVAVGVSVGDAETGSSGMVFWMLTTLEP